MELLIEKLQSQAVDAAIAHDWENAITINKHILEKDPENIDTLLALSFAFLEKGDYPSSKNSYKKVLDLDPTNVIARNNLEKLTILMKRGDSHENAERNAISFDPNTFIKLKGKTLDITLINIGQAEVLASLKIGEKVELKIKKRRLEVRSLQGEYIGCLPDDVSKRLIYFIEAGSQYTTYVKAATKNSADVFIREESRGEAVKHYVSFPENLQDDMKVFIGKGDDEDSDDEHADPDDDGYDVTGLDDAKDLDLDDEEFIDDLDELANDTSKDEYFGIHTMGHDDDDLDE